MTQRFSRPTTQVGRQMESNPTPRPTWERAKALRLSGRPAEAERVLRGAIADGPNDYRLHYELGMALTELNRHEEAIGSFLAVLRFNADCDDACIQLGHAFAARGMLKPATEWYEQARKLNPAETSFLYSYGRALMSVGCLKLAEEVLDAWTKAEPDNPIARHLSSAALGSQEVTTASKEYVRAHFDDFAPRFDESLARIQYCGPQLVVNALRQVAGTAAGEWDILDLGCGTGLIGIELRPFARRLVGVDLSPK